MFPSAPRLPLRLRYRYGRAYPFGVVLRRRLLIAVTFVAAAPGAAGPVILDPVGTYANPVFVTPTRTIRADSSSSSEMARSS